MGIDSNNRAGGGAAYSRFAEEMDIDSVNLQMRGSPAKTQAIRTFCLDHWKLLIVLVIAALCFGIGIILGHFITATCRVESSTNGIHSNATVPADSATPTPSPTSTQNYMTLIKNHIEKRSLIFNLLLFTSEPHHAGSSGNLDQARYIYNTWTNYGFSVIKKNYTVLLSRPNPQKPNRLRILNTVTQEEVKVFEPDDRKPGSLMYQPFAVYGSNASITSQPVYVNYATTEDFASLRERTQIDYENKICIARLGKIPLAQMAQISKDRHCVGLVAFPDPQPYAYAGTTVQPLSPQTAFPRTWWLPKDGVLRESARLSMGDPSSPFFPSHDWTPRQSITNLLDGFPVQTISYDDAQGLLRLMHNPPASDGNWTGGLPVYNVGPGFHDDNRILSFEVNNELKFTKITNVIATIKGTVEPDRYVIIGNHRDSLTSGLVSPGSGKACLMEVAKVLSELMKQGWKPRRTVILASWDAGEDGSIGSTEWVEENMERLHSRGVAYINLDDAVSGNYSFAAAGSPLLSKAIFQATQDVNCPDPSHENMSIHHNWASRRPISNTDPQPQLDPLGTSSDSAPFLLLAGVPAVDLQYVYDEMYYKVPKYPTYHTAFDESENINSFIDPDFSIHVAVTEVAAETLMLLADTPKLPMDLTHYGESLTRYVQQFKMQYGSLLTEQGISLDRLETAVANFSTAAQTFQQTFDTVAETDELTVREMNDHMLSVERAFLVNAGSTVNPESRHLIFGASTTSMYKGAAFGPLAQLIVMEKELGNWIFVEQALGYTILGLQAATATLTDAQLH